MTEETVEEFEAEATFDFDEAFQLKVAALCTRDVMFNVRTSGLIEPGYFENAAHGTIVGLVSNHYDTYKTVPSTVVLAKLIKDAVASKIIREDMLPDVKTELGKILRADLSDRDYVVDQVATFARHQAIYNAMIKSSSYLEKNDFDQIEAQMGKAIMVGANDASEAHDLFLDIEARAEMRKEIAAGTRKRAVTSGYREFDDATADGGFTRGELSVLMGPAKMGKCVTGDTLIITEDGMVRIDDYLPPDMPTGAMDAIDIGILGKDGAERASHIYNSGVRKTRRIRTRRGYEIEGSLNHPMMVMTKNGLDWVNLEDVRKGDAMAVQRGELRFGHHVDLIPARNATFDWIEFSPRRGTHNLIKLPVAMTPDLAELLGMIVAEGHVAIKDALVTFTQKDESILRRYCELMHRHFGLEPTVSKGDRAFEARVYNRMLQVFLDKLGLPATLSAQKEIPKSIRRAPYGVVKRFLETVMGLEGSVVTAPSGKLSYHLTMASKELMRQVHLQLLNFGIVCKMRLKPGCATNGTGIMREYWHIEVAGQHNLQLLAEIGLYEPRKTKALKEGLTGIDATAQDRIPNAAAKVTKIMQEMMAAGIKLKRDVPPTLCKQLYAVKSGRRHLSYVIADQLSEFIGDRVMGEGVTWLRDTLRQGYAYDEIVEIVEGEAQTMDISVPETNSFWANGLISHNSFGLLNFAVNAIKARFNVLFISLENSVEVTTNRAEAYLSGIPTRDLNDHIDEVAQKVRAALEGRGTMKVHRFATNSFSPRDLKRLIERYRAQGMLFDMVVIDYWDIMKPPIRYKDDKISESREIGVELRQIAMEEDIAMLTAVQTNREGYKAKTAKADHVAEDFNKVRLADFLFSINATDQEKADKVARLYFAAVRNAEGGYERTVHQDLARATFIKKFEPKGSYGE